MASYNDLNVQCFARRSSEPLFTGENQPDLLYISYVRPNVNEHPRILHSHENHTELLLICSGESSFMIHDRSYPVRLGDLVVYNAGIVHDDRTDAGTEIEYYCVAVGKLHMPGLPENVLIGEDKGFVFQTGKQFEPMRALCALMFESLSSEEADAEVFSRSLMHALLVKALTVVNGLPRERVPALAEENVLGIRIKDYIDEHFTEPLTLQSIADALHMSSYYLSHVFKEMSGYSPIQYLLRRRLGEAQTLLLSSDLSISDIAGEVGFETQNYFNAQFTKHVGMPPKKYRESYLVSKEIEQKRRQRRTRKR